MNDTIDGFTQIWAYLIGAAVLCGIAYGYIRLYDFMQRKFWNRDNWRRAGQAYKSRWGGL